MRYRTEKNERDTRQKSPGCVHGGSNRPSRGSETARRRWRMAHCAGGVMSAQWVVSSRRCMFSGSSQPPRVGSHRPITGISPSQSSMRRPSRRSTGIEPIGSHGMCLAVIMSTPLAITPLTVETDSIRLGAARYVHVGAAMIIAHSDEGGAGLIGSLASPRQS